MALHKSTPGKKSVSKTSSQLKKSPYDIKIVATIIVKQYGEVLAKLAKE